MKHIAMTGGIASGKSTVAEFIRKTGTPIADADDFCRAVMEPGMPAALEIARRWPEVMTPGGIIDRAALGKIVFSDDSARREEASIVLPAIHAAYKAWAAECEAAGCALCVYDAALIFEHGLQKEFDGVLLVEAAPEIQIRRVMERNGFSEGAARLRIRAQMPLEEKRRQASWIIKNNGTLKDLEREFQRVWAAVMRFSKSD